ncbi:kinase-like domain-containing protein [Apiospora sp. TS-2023a]
MSNPTPDPGVRVPPAMWSEDPMDLATDTESRDNTAADKMSELSPYNTDGMIDYNAQQSPSKKGGSDTSNSNAVDRLQDVKNYFIHAGLRFRKPIAIGNHGGTVLFDKFNHDDDGREILAKSLVVKYALDTEDDASTHNDEDLENEMEWLQKMHHAEHIIQTEPDYWNLWDKDKKDGTGSVGHVLKKPVIVMEYMEHGTIQGLIDRFSKEGIRIPDRMLWYFALCLVRACIAMGYRDQFAGAETTTRERVPKPAEKGGSLPPPSGLAQLSMKGANVLIADLIPNDAEHQLVPLIKLIDFGRGIVYDYKSGDPIVEGLERYKEYIGVLFNLDGVGYLGAAEFNVKPSKWTTEENAVFYRVKEFQTGADPTILEDQSIDRQLRDTIAMFRSYSASALPTLNDALGLCMTGIRNINKSTNPIDSTESIRQLVQRLVFNADLGGAAFEYNFTDSSRV